MSQNYRVGGPHVDFLSSSGYRLKDGPRGPKNQEPDQVVVVHPFNPNTQEADEGGSLNSRTE